MWVDPLGVALKHISQGFFHKVTESGLEPSFGDGFPQESCVSYRCWSIARLCIEG